MIQEEAFRMVGLTGGLVARAANINFDMRMRHHSSERIEQQQYRTRVNANAASTRVKVKPSSRVQPWIIYKKEMHVGHSYRAKRSMCVDLVTRVRKDTCNQLHFQGMRIVLFNAVLAQVSPKDSIEYRRAIGWLWHAVHESIREYSKCASVSELCSRPSKGGERGAEPTGPGRDLTAPSRVACARPGFVLLPRRG